MNQQAPIVVAMERPPARGVLFWAGVVAAAFVALVLVGKGVETVSTMAKKRRTRRLCAEMAPHGSVLAVLYAPAGEAEAAAGTLLSAYRAARCGPSLRAAVYQEVQGVSGTYEALQRMATTAEEEAWAKDCVAIVTTAREHVGLFWAWGQLLAERDVFPDAEWIVSVRPGASFSHGWDKALVEAHGAARRGLNRKHVALTFSPKPATRPRRRRGGNKSPYDLTFWTERALEAVDTNANEGAPGAWKFPVVMDFKGYLPQFTERRFPEPPKRATQPLGVTHRALFAPAKAFRQMTELELFQEPVASYAVDVALSAMLWMDRHAFALAPPVVSEGTARRATLRPEGWDGKAFAGMLADDYGPYFSDYLGVDLDAREPSGQAMLGVLPGQAEGDILAKYGSMGEYERAMRHYGILGE